MPPEEGQPHWEFWPAPSVGEKLEFVEEQDLYIYYLIYFFVIIKINVKLTCGEPQWRGKSHLPQRELPNSLTVLPPEKVRFSKGPWTFWCASHTVELHCTSYSGFT